MNEEDLLTIYNKIQFALRGSGPKNEKIQKLQEASTLIIDMVYPYEEDSTAANNLLATTASLGPVNL